MSNTDRYMQSSWLQMRPVHCRGGAEGGLIEPPSWSLVAVF